MRKYKRIIVVIGLLILLSAIGIDYHNEMNKVNETVIRRIAEYTLLIEKYRVDESEYELKQKLEVAEGIDDLIPINEQSKQEVYYILVLKDLNELLYRISYSEQKGKLEEAHTNENEYMKRLDTLKSILSPYREDYIEVETLWSQGVFSD